MAPRAMPAGGASLRCCAGPAAAGIAEFLGGRAFFPVADARGMLVRLAARAGVFGHGIRINRIFRVGFCGALDLFWHGTTLVIFRRYNYSYAHKSFKGLHPTLNP